MYSDQGDIQNLHTHCSKSSYSHQSDSKCRAPRPRARPPSRRRGRPRPRLQWCSRLPAATAWCALMARTVGGIGSRRRPWRPPLDSQPTRPPPLPTLPRGSTIVRGLTKALNRPPQSGHPSAHRAISDGLLAGGSSAPSNAPTNTPTSPALIRGWQSSRPPPPPPMRLPPSQPPLPRRSRRIHLTRTWLLRAVHSSGGAREPRGATTTTMRRPHSPRASAPVTIHRRCPRAPALPRHPRQLHRLNPSTPRHQARRHHRRRRPSPPAAPTVSPRPCRMWRGAPCPRRPGAASRSRARRMALGAPVAGGGASASTCTSSCPSFPSPSRAPPLSCRAPSPCLCRRPWRRRSHPSRPLSRSPRARPPPPRSTCAAAGAAATLRCRTRRRHAREIENGGSDNGGGSSLHSRHSRLPNLRHRSPCHTTSRRPPRPSSRSTSGGAACPRCGSPSMATPSLPLSPPPPRRPPCRLALPSAASLSSPYPRHWPVWRAAQRRRPRRRPTQRLSAPPTLHPRRQPHRWPTQRLSAPPAHHPRQQSHRRPTRRLSAPPMHRPHRHPRHRPTRRLSAPPTHHPRRQPHRRPTRRLSAPPTHHPRR